MIRKSISSYVKIPAGTQRWINVETTLYSYVESTLILSWIWKLKQRWNRVHTMEKGSLFIEPKFNMKTTIFQRLINVEK
jgi:hypothetical protein